MTATDWLAAFSSELGVPAPDQATVDTLLELAGVAAHSSERIAAPIACYLLGTKAMSPVDGLELSKRVSAACRGPEQNPHPGEAGTQPPAQLT